jgi:large subunit ribosomal protein L10
MALTKAKKEQLVADYAEKLDRSQAVILTNHQGLNVAQISNLRHRLRAVGTGYQVIKNTLFRLALEEMNLPELGELLEGPTSTTFCYEEVQPAAQVLMEFGSEAGTFAVKGGLLGSRPLGRAEIGRLATLPSQEIVLLQVLSALQSPIRGLVNVLSGPMRGLITVLQARSDQLAPADS